jgi:glycosyltransferase involved in cell wall biosynthesis
MSMPQPVKPLRMSVVEPAGWLYGSEYALLDILEMLEPNEISTEVILPRNAPFQKLLDQAFIETHPFLVSLAHQTGRLRKVFSYVQLAIHWTRNRPDLIYVNQGGILRPIAAIAKRLNIPILCQIQTLEDAEWVSTLRSVHRQVMTFVCNSDFTQSQTKVPVDRSSMVYYGYKRKGLSGSRPELNASAMTVGLLGRIGKSKGQELIIEVSKILKSKNRKDIRFRFIGAAATQREQDAIERLVQDEGVSEFIEFRGYRQDISNELNQLHLMVIPSVSEPFGRVFCEAAEAGLPALVSDSGGLGELSLHFGLGARFRARDATALCNKLIEIRENYSATLHTFLKDADRFLSRLDLETYGQIMRDLILRSASRQLSSVSWKGLD